MGVGRTLVWVLIGSISFALAYWQAFAGVTADSLVGDTGGVIPVGKQLTLPDADSFQKKIPEDADLTVVLTSTCRSCSVDRLGISALLGRKQGIVIVWDGDATELIEEHPDWRQRHFLVHKALALAVPSWVRKLAPAVVILKHGRIVQFAPANSPSARELLR